MEETKIELERVKLTNYILKKENEILLETIGVLTRDKEQILIELENCKKNIGYRATKKIKNTIKKIIRRK